MSSQRRIPPPPVAPPRTTPKVAAGVILRKPVAVPAPAAHVVQALKVHQRVTPRTPVAPPPLRPPAMTRPMPPRVAWVQPAGLRTAQPARPAVIQCKLSVSAKKAIAKALKKSQNLIDLALVYDQNDLQTQTENWQKLTKFLNTLAIPGNDENVGELCGIIQTLAQKWNLGQVVHWANPGNQVQPVQVQVEEELELNESKKVSEFYEGIEYTHNPQNARGLALVNGGAYNNTISGEPAQKITTAMQRPDSSKVVTSSQQDGEVLILAEALKRFVAAMRDKELRKRTQFTFSLDIAGRDGACDGCKARITKFLALWKLSATNLLYEGVTASLTVTYKYENQAYEPRNDGNVYGWDDDPFQGGWYVHREQEEATGTKKKQEQEQK